MKEFDIYIDEDKLNKKIGFLVVKNSPYMQQILYNKRQKFDVYNEVHFKSLNNKSVNLVKSWINLFFNFEKIYKLKEKICFFEIRDWNKKIENKKEIIKDFISSLNTKNVVVFMDFDTEYKKINIENSIKKDLKILRVFHLDSKASDLLQLSDILLGASIRGKNSEISKEDFQKLSQKIKDKKDLSKSELKNFIGKYLQKKTGAVVAWATVLTYFIYKLYYIFSKNQIYYLKI